jgi:hypothetical protein
MEEDLEEHRVVEESVESARREEEEVHRTVEDSFESLCDDRVRAWLRVKNNKMKVAASLQIPASMLDDAIREVWIPWLGARPPRKLGQRTRFRAAPTILPARGHCSTRQTHQVALAQAPAGAAMCSTVQTHLAPLAPAGAAQ